MSALGRETRVGVIGAGVMGAGIAQVAAAAGHPVVLQDVRAGAAESAKGKIAESLAKLVEKGRMGAEEREALLGRINPCDSLDALAGSGLVVEAIIEDLKVKRELFTDLERLTPAECILTSNTSSLSITELAAGLNRPERFAGLHFFNPAPIMPLVEVVGGLATESSVVKTLVQTAATWGKTPVIAKSTPGFIVNKGARPFYGEPLRFFEEGGADAATIDALMRASGFRMGPLELIDLIGLDINLAASRSMYEAYYHEPRYKPSLVVEERVAAGRLGRKTKQGFYSYHEETRPEAILLPPGTTPAKIKVRGWPISPAEEQLIGLLQQAGIEVEMACEPGLGGFEADGVLVHLTYGETATEIATLEKQECVVFDLALDYATCDHIAIASALSAPEKARSLAAGLFQALNKKVSQVEDVPGLLVGRTVAMLVNEASDTLLRQTATIKDIDTAMQKGLNFPGGPLAWADRLDAGYCVRLLSNLQKAYGEERYRPNVLLQRFAQAGVKFHA